MTIGDHVPGGNRCERRDVDAPVTGELTPRRSLPSARAGGAEEAGGPIYSLQKALGFLLARRGF